MSTQQHGRQFVVPLLAGLLIVAVDCATPSPMPDDASAETPTVSGKWLLPERQPWAGEVFELELRWQIYWPRFNFLEGDVQWSAGAVVAAPWSRAITEPPSPDSNTGHVTITTNAMALAPGKLSLSPAQQKFSLLKSAAETPGTPRLARSEIVESAESPLDIAALPPAPESFSGAVGNFNLTTDLSAPEVAVGETLVWTLSLHGTGNWPMRPAMPARKLPASFALVEPPALRQIPGASVFEGRLEETLLLTPTMEGRHELPAVKAVVFDPEKARYVTLTTPARSVLVTPGIGRPRYADSALAPPRWHPIPGAGPAWVPPDDLVWVMWLLAPLTILISCWLVFSLMHAWRTNPWRRARRAQIQLRGLLPLLAATSDHQELCGRLRAWQRLTAQRFFIRVAAPTPRSLSREPEWARLWREADAAMYGGAEALPPDWLRRADLLLARVPLPPPFNPVRALHPNHLFARHNVAAVGLCLILLLATPASPGQDLQKTIPGDDWITSYNHAVDLLQDEQLNEAAAYAAAAWLRSPADARAHALWLHTAQRTGMANLGVPQPTQSLAAGLMGISPAFWRWMAVAALSVLSLAAALALARRFGHSAPSIRTVVTLTLLGGSSALVSFGLLGQYGIAASPDAVVLWREAIARPLPIEQPGDNEASTLAPGTVAHAGKALLGWRQIQVNSGDKVWVRHSDLVWLWRETASSAPTTHENRVIGGPGQAADII